MTGTMPAGPSGAPRPRCSSTWKPARSTTRSTSPSAAATTTGAVQRHGLADRIASFLCPSDNNAGMGGSPPFGSNNTPNINSYRGSVGTTSLAGWNNGPGYGSCQPDPLNIIGGNPGCQPYSTGMFAYWICVRHQGLHRRHVADHRLLRVAGRRPGCNRFAPAANQLGDRRRRCPGRRRAGRFGAAGDHAAAGPSSLYDGLSVGHEPHQRQRLPLGLGCDDDDLVQHDRHAELQAVPVEFVPFVVRRLRPG